MVVTLLLLTSLVYYLPNAALAAIIMVSVTGLIDTREIRYLFRVKKSEGLLLTFTFLATLSLGIIYGLAAGIVASILLFISLNTKPNAAILGRLPGTNIFRNAKDFPQAETIDNLVILRIDASFYFANTEFLKNRLRDITNEYEGMMKALILDASAINDLDSSADSALHQIAEEFQKKGITLYIAGVKGPVREVMRRSGLYEKLGSDHFFFTIDAAVKRFVKKQEVAVDAM
jgi:SulP family sulfate permease